MEANLPSMQGNASYGSFDSQASIRIHHQQQQHPLSLHHQHNPHPRPGISPMAHPTIHENFPLTIGSTQEHDQAVSLADYDKMDRVKSASDEDEPEDTKGKKSSTWQRVKWTDTMVRLLITAVSYISEEEHMRRKISNLQKKGKWKSVSKVMEERGHFVSPQQCEDKFNDLNKRYKRLNEILGRGTSCEVVENPSLLEVMDHISDKSKEEVRKILSSKHLHYEEMCSYHNGNRLHLPPDPELQHSLRLALMPRDDIRDDYDVKRHVLDDDHDVKRHARDGNDEGEEEGEFDDDDDDLDGCEENQRSMKRVKQCGTRGEFSFGNSLLDCNKTLNFQTENVGGDANLGLNEDAQTNVLQKQWMNQRNLQLEEKRLHIQVQTLELEKERFRWQRFCRKKDRELEMMKVEIERMKLENERMALDLRRKEMGIDDD